MSKPSKPSEPLPGEWARFTAQVRNLPNLEATFNFIEDGLTLLPAASPAREWLTNFAYYIECALTDSILDNRPMPEEQVKLFTFWETGCRETGEWAAVKFLIREYLRASAGGQAFFLKLLRNRPEAMAKAGEFPPQSPSRTEHFIRDWEARTARRAKRKPLSANPEDWVADAEEFMKEQAKR